MRAVVWERGDGNEKKGERGSEAFIAERETMLWLKLESGHASIV